MYLVPLGGIEAFAKGGSECIFSHTELPGFHFPFSLCRTHPFIQKCIYIPNQSILVRSIVGVHVDFIQFLRMRVRAIGFCFRCRRVD